jgi:hypothetical protein
MKLVFRKSEDEQISVFQSVDGGETAFLYTELISTLIGDPKLEDAELVGDFTDEEKRSIASMVSSINAVLCDEEADDETSD